MIHGLLVLSGLYVAAFLQFFYDAVEVQVTPALF